MTGSTAQDSRTFVVVGASLAGAKAAETLREEGFTGRVVLVGEEPEPPYERPPLSKGYLLGSDERDTAFVHDRAWYDKQNIELRTGVRAESLDPAAHTVTLSTGEQLGYDELLLTTGSVVRRLPVPGADLEGVHYLRRIEHSDTLRGVLVDGARVVVIGGGWIGLEVTAAARTHGATVTLVEVDALPLRQVLGDEVAQVFADLHAERGVDLRLGTGIQEIVGTGGRVASVTLDDGTSVPADAVVVGGGWIGLEVAAAARTHGAAVTLVEIDTLPLRRVLGDEVARVFADLHAEHGVDLHLGTGVREIVGSGGRVASVTLDDGSSVPADSVVVGVGITPAVELAQAAGLAVDDGVLVDAALRTSDPDVYAAGDVANAENPLLHRRVRVEHWSNALNGGPAAARSMLGQDVVYDPVPYFFTDQYDLGMEYSGHVEPGGYDRVVFRGDVAGREFIAFWLADGRVLAGMNVNIWDVAEDIERIVRSGAQVDPARLADPEVPLAEL